MRHLALLLLFAGSGPAQEPAAPLVVLPRQSVASSPVGAVDVLPVGKLFVIKSKVRCNVYDSPLGLVKVEALNKDDKPLEGIALAYSQFFDGDGYEKREYGGDDFRFVYMVTSLPNVTGQVELIIAPDGSRTPLRRMLSVGGPRPPPEPEPIPPKPPTPDPANPLPSPILKVLIRYDSAKTFSPELTGVINSTIATNYIKSVNGEYGRVPFNEDMTAHTQWFRDASKRQHTGSAWVILSSPKGFFEGPLPTTHSAYMDLLKRYGG